jgi:HipA-like protein
MAKSSGEQIWVWLDDPAYGPLEQIGTLSRGDRGSVRFSYEPGWLKRAHAFPLDPGLDLTAGEFFPGDANFGVFMDSCPDRWGQILMKRREAVEAKDEGRTPRTLGSWEFLLGVQDCTRMGALRYSRPEEIKTMKKTFTILHTNDMHSSFIGMGPASDYKPFILNDDATRGGYARLAGLNGWRHSTTRSAARPN